ncbi:MAG: CoA ester lyase [Syntrophobacteraceae bacterium]|nr:CoA ester lyase [Syntrophobacteraceae bacterium]
MKENCRPRIADPQVRLCRSIISVPANREKMAAKALGLDADVIMLDLEDSVPVEQKDEARERAVAVLRGANPGGKVFSLRINGMDTPFAYRDLIDVVERAGEFIDTIVIPKVNEGAQVKAVDYFLTQIELRMGFRRPIGLEPSIETASGMMRVEEIGFSSPRIEALVFGVADYSASLTMPGGGISGHGEREELYPGDRYHFPLSRMAMAAKAAGVAAIDAPYGDYKDPEGLRRSCLASGGLGYDGKWVIHPDQIGIVNEVYTPSEEAFERSKRILEAYEQARAAGVGSIALDGKMVDGASIRVAQVVRARREAIDRNGKKT